MLSYGGCGWNGKGEGEQEKQGLRKEISVGLWVRWVLIEEGEGRELFFEEGEGRELVLHLSGFRKVLCCVKKVFFFCIYRAIFLILC